MFTFAKLAGSARAERPAAMPIVPRPSLLSVVIRLWENDHDHGVYLDDP